jgi:hypothetical protein
MLETYTIDPALLGNIRKRMITRLGIVMVISILIVFVPQLLDRSKLDIKSSGIALCFTMTILIFTMNKALNRQINSFKTLRIVLNDEGIESKAELQPYKRIEWNALQIKEKPNGTIDLYDKSISKFNRKMYGRGWIHIQPETLDKDKMLNTIRLKAPYAF